MTLPTWPDGLSLDLTPLQKTAEITMSSFCEIQERSYFVDSQGGYPVTDSDDDWRSIYSQVPCRIAELSGRESFLKNQPTVEGDWVLTLPVNFSLTEANRVLLEGQVYEITLTNAHRAYKTAQRLLLRRIS